MASLTLPSREISNISKEETDEISSLEWELGKLSSQLDWIDSYRHQLEDRIEFCQRQLNEKKSGRRNWFKSVTTLFMK